MHTLKPYQEDGVAFMQNVHGGILLADQPGLGKTAQVLTLAHRKRLWPMLVVCPASLKGNWKKEARMWTDLPEEEILILAGKDSSQTDGNARKLTIINYDILSDWKAPLAQQTWACMAIDECHALSDRGSKRTKAAKYLSRFTTKVIAMSGTPVMNRPADFFPILNIIRPGEFGNWQEYAWKYCAPHKTRWGWEYKGADNLDDLHKRIQPFTLRRLKSDVLKELSDKEYSVVPIKLSPEDETVLVEAEGDFLKWLERNSSYGNVHRAQKAEAVTKVGILLRLTSRLKARQVVQWIKNYMIDHPAEKVVLFAVHKAMVDVLARRVYPDGTVVIDGSTPTAKRTAIVEQFQNDPNIRVMVANIKAAGVGLTLTAARTVINTELWWTPSATEQGADRVHRIGQTEDCRIISLLVPGSSEEKIAKAIQTKKNVSDSIIDGKPANDMTVLDMLLKPNRKVK